MNMWSKAKTHALLIVTILGVAVREALIFSGVSYDSGGLGTVVFFVAEGLSVLVNVAAELLDYVLIKRGAIHYLLALSLGLGAAFFLDRTFASWRRRRHNT
jgi:hypothetical protein